MNPAPLIAVGDLLFFYADSPASGFEPWISDGTAAGTFLLKDINPGVDESVPGPFPVL